jgi:hypothetical protein
MKVPTIAEIKKMLKRPELVTLAEAVFMAMAYERTIAAIVKPKQQEVIDFFKFEVTEEHEKRLADGLRVVDSVEHLYLADKQDWAIFQAEMDKFYVEQGIKPEKEGCCPLLIAESMTREANHLFAEALAPFFELDLEKMLYTREKEFVEIHLTLFASHVNPHKHLQAA